MDRQDCQTYEAMQEKSVIFPINSLAYEFPLARALAVAQQRDAPSDGNDVILYQGHVVQPSHCIGFDQNVSRYIARMTFFLEFEFRPPCLSSVKYSQLPRQDRLRPLPAQRFFEMLKPVCHKSVSENAGPAKHELRGKLYSL